jgi:hypothetical protein
MKKTIKFDI